MRNFDLTEPGHVPGKDHANSLVWIEEANEPVLALSRVYPSGHRVPVHSHRRTQIWCARKGSVLVSTADGRFMVPPGHGLIIPAGLDHSAETFSRVEMQSIYVDPQVIRPARPRVVEITMLALGLIGELMAEDLHERSARRRMLVRDLLLDEIELLPERPLGLPFPEDMRLAALCRHFLKTPSARAEIDEWASGLGISRRSFTRLFRAETGVSFATWRQQACIFASLPRLAAGESVTNVALDAGYENVAAFTTMFRRMLGSAPRAYLKEARARSVDTG